MNEQLEKRDVMGRMTAQEIEYMLLGILRLPTLFHETKSMLRLDHFDYVTEKGYRQLWGVALDMSTRYESKLPTGNISNLFEMAITKRRNEDPQLLDQVDAHNLLDPEKGLVGWIFSYPPEQIHKDEIRYFRTEFIRERAMDAHVRFVQAAHRTGLTKERQKELEESWQRVSSVRQYDTDQVIKETFTTDILDAPEDPQAALWSTGLKFVDDYMNGGQRAGEAYTLMGPTGVGKTTLGLQMLVEAARTQQSMCKQGNIEAPGVACYFSFEMPFDDLVGRMWSYACAIHSDTFKNGIRGIRSKLSKKGELKTYELEKFKNEIAVNGAENHDGELERLLKAMEELKPLVLLSDMRGLDPDNKLMGTNGIDDIVSALNGLVDNGKRIAWVAIDYAGLVVDRYMDARNISKELKRHYLNSFILDAIGKIAIPFGCPAWVMHQVNAEGNRKAAGNVIHHTQAAEATGFVNNAIFAFQLGNKDQHNICDLQCTKTRRSGGLVQAPVLQIDGPFCRMYDISNDMAFDPTTHMYMKKSLLNTRAAPPAVSRQRSTQQPEVDEGGVSEQPR